MPNDIATDQIELLAATLKALQASTGAELIRFNFTPHFIGPSLIRVDAVLTFDPMLEEE